MRVCLLHGLLFLGGAAAFRTSKLPDGRARRDGTTRRQWLGAASSLLLSGAAAPALAELVDVASLPDGGETYIFPILAAQRDVQRLLKDEASFRTMVSIGLPSTSLPMPPLLSFSVFKRIEESARDPGAFMDGAIEYVEYSRDANDLLRLAEVARATGGERAAASVADYLDRAMEAARGSERALARLVPLLPGTPK